MHFLLPFFTLHFALSTLYYLRRQPPSLSPGKCEIRKAAASSPILAAFSLFSATLPRSRRFFAHKILNAAPTSLLAADHCGDNFRHCINFITICNYSAAF
jgi:hypothetical protein